MTAKTKEEIFEEYVQKVENGETGLYDAIKRGFQAGAKSKEQEFSDKVKKVNDFIYEELISPLEARNRNSFDGFEDDYEDWLKEAKNKWQILSSLEVGESYRKVNVNTVDLTEENHSQECLGVNHVMTNKDSSIYKDTLPDTNSQKENQEKGK